ncbi:MAX gene-associated protein [Discoglossus pictus]
MEKPDTSPVGEEGSSGTPVSTPAYFVILQPKGDNSKAEKGIFVAKQDLSAVASVMSPGSDRSKSKASCTSGKITVTLDNNNMWNEFYRCTTEMILTKQGRRMFPYCRYWISGLCSHQKYILVMDITPMDNYRYKWNGQSWEPGGISEPHVLGRVFIHPESPSTGQFWMHQPVSFYKLKLTNNILDQDGHIILHSMHRYLPRLHVIPASKTTEVIQLNGPDVHTFTFPQTEFIAVTAYQNFQITQLKIDCNPFAKGFREGAVTGRPLKQNNSSQEGESSDSKTLVDSDCGQKMEEQFRASDHSDVELEAEAFIAERDFVNFLKQNINHGDTHQQKDNKNLSFDGNSSVASFLNTNGQHNTVIKEEPVDDYDYEKPVPTEGIEVKQEESEEEITDEYSNSDDDYPILERQLRKQSAQFRREANNNRKRSSTSPSGVAKAKMLKLDSGKMPVVYLEPCSVPKSNMEFSDLEKMGLNPEKLRSLLARAAQSVASDKPDPRNQSTTSNVDTQSSNKENQQTQSKNNTFVEGLSTKDQLNGSQVSSVNIKKLPFLLPKPTVNEKVEVPKPFIPVVRSKRGRPRKNKVADLPSSIQKSGSDELQRPFPNVVPDLEDVDGLLFVAFASKEALDVHTGGKPTQAVTSTPQVLPDLKEEKGDHVKIKELERQLLNELRMAKHKQVIHPALQQVGLKLNIVDPTMSIDLRYLGVQLPLPYIDNETRWDNYGLCAQASEFPFVSRTGKTNDYTKIKGWRDKFSTNSPCEGSSSESSLKNRSAFCSDKLDEYLENEAKLMENCKGLSQDESESSVVYQLPTKSTSYVRTLDSVLKKQVSQARLSSYTLKPLSLPTSKKQVSTSIKSSTPKGKSNTKFPPSTVKAKSAASTFSVKSMKSSSSNQANSLVSSSLQCSAVSSSAVPSIAASSSVISTSAELTSVVPTSVPTEEVNLLPNLRPAQLQNSYQSSLRPSGLSKAYMKLLDIEECIVWDGKPRTYVTEERADIALATLLTAQASLKNKPVHKIIRRRAGNCRNEFCRLGCVCSSVNHEKRKPTHCRRVDCMFGCTCLKHKVILVRGGVKIRKISKENVQENSEEEEPHSTAQENSDTAEGVNNSVPRPILPCFPIWKKSEEDSDSEPISIPVPNELNEIKSQEVTQTEARPPDKTKSPGTNKSRVYVPKPNPVIRPEDMDPVYLYFDSMMTCARVRVYSRKPPEDQFKENYPSTYDSLDFSAKEYSHKSSKHRPKGKEKQEEIYEPYCSSKWYCNSGLAKLVEIISDCNWEEDRRKILNIVSENMYRKEPQLFKVGNFNIELMSESKSGDVTGTTTYSSRVKISLADGQETDGVSEWKVESVKLPECSFRDTSPEKEKQEMSHGGKCLPFYTKIIPAGKLVARLKNSNINNSELVQVNGKKYPQAKLLLGQMGALHPANRLAAYITHRLQPSLYNMTTHATLNTIVATKKAAPSTDEKPNETSLTPQKVTLPTQAVSQNAVTQPTIHITRAPMVASGTDKRLGPRLLLIPVQSNTPTVRPVQSVPHTPGQKMVLQPIKSPTGTNLFRHPNGQIIQLVPIQQIRAPTITPSSQVVFRNPGAVVGIRLPLPSKPETPSTSVAPALSNAFISTSQVVSSLPTTIPSSTPVTFVSSPPPFLSQTGTLRLRITPPTASGATPETSAKVVTYNSSGQVMGSSGLPLQSGSFALLNIPSQNTVPKNMAETPSNSSNINTEVKSASTSSINEEVSHNSSVELVTNEENLKKDDCVELVESCKSESLKDLSDSASENEDIGESQDKLHDGENSDERPRSPASSSETADTPDSIVKPRETDKIQLKGSVKSNAQKPMATDCLPTEQCSAESKSEPQPPVSLPAASNNVHCDTDLKENAKVSRSDKKECSVGSEKDNEIIDCTLSDSDSDGDVENSEFDEDSVDIETVEELSEKISIARLKATASNSLQSPQKGNKQMELSKSHKKGISKKGKVIKREEDEDATTYHRRTHTANERRRRNEMRDLFEGLKNSLGLHNLPKVSKSYILKQAIEEIEGLTDQADTLIKKKTLLSQKKAFLIKKVSTLSGKTKEVVVKKLEYIYAKQKAVEAEKKKKHFEEDIALHKASLMARLPRTEEEPMPSFRKEDVVVEIPSEKTKKPLILGRKKVVIPIETTPSKPIVSLSAANMVMAPQGTLVTLKNPVITGEVEEVTSTALQSELNAKAGGPVKPGLTSMRIQLPGPIQVNGILANAQIPITLSAVPDPVIAGVVSPPPDEEKEDLSMMPRIVNVTSLANELSIDGELGLSTNEVKEDFNLDTDPSLMLETMSGTIPDPEPAQSRTEDSYDGSCLPPPLVLLDSTTDLPDATPETSAPNVIESLTLGDSSTTKRDTAVVAAKVVKEARFDLELKKVTSALDESELDASDLIDVIGDQEDADETLTSLLNEIAFLNQQLNNDDLDSSSDFPGSDTASRGSVSKFTDGDASPFSFGRFKELSEIKEKNSSLSPLFLQLEEGEMQENSRQIEEAGIMAFVGDEASPSSSRTSFGLQEANVTSNQMMTKQEYSVTDSLWRPMPKLAPLGLKAATLSAEQRAQENKAMPSLAPVTVILNSMKSTSPAEEQSNLGS